MKKRKRKITKFIIETRNENYQWNCDGFGNEDRYCIFDTEKEANEAAMEMIEIWGKDAEWNEEEFVWRIRETNDY